MFLNILFLNNNIKHNIVITYKMKYNIVEQSFTLVALKLLYNFNEYSIKKFNILKSQRSLCTYT